MTDDLPYHGPLVSEVAAAAAPGALADRRDLAFIAVERTRMPMVVTDVREHDNPIVLANQAFLEKTGYSAEEVIGRNCRFLQGADTDPAAVAKLRAAVAEGREATVELVNYRKDGTPFWNQLFFSPVRDDSGKLRYFFGSQMDVTRRRTAEELEAAEHSLLREVDHRAKNALAMVQGIVRLSRAPDAESYAASVQGRVDSLARAHAILAESRWRNVQLDRLIQAEIEPFGRLRVSLDGPPVELTAKQAQPFALLLHEMLANAAAHGALSAPDGVVAIEWHLDSDRRLIAIHWREHGGPVPSSEPKPGFGSTMIDAIVRRQLGGNASFRWCSEGLESEMVIPIGTRGAQLVA